MLSLAIFMTKYVMISNFFVVLLYCGFQGYFLHEIVSVQCLMHDMHFIELLVTVAIDKKIQYTYK